MAKQLFDCVFGPRLFYIYRCDETGVTTDKKYLGNVFERQCDQILSWLSFFAKMVMYNLPLIGIYWYRKEYTIKALLTSVVCKRALGSVSVLFASAYLIRGLGRAASEEYCKFLRTVMLAKENGSNSKSRKLLDQYDFDFKYWPIDFSWNEYEVEHNAAILESQNNDRQRSKTLMIFIKALPCEIIKYILAHSVGRRVVYPGSLAFIQMAMKEYLEEGRRKLVIEFAGIRAKILTADGNTIDSMFVDRRDEKREVGTVLIICSGGNAAYYEAGSMETPLTCDEYSVLGWNHPGFACSTGLPFPKSEALAIDAVIRYAINKLGFSVENIVLYSWSIGGYCTAVGAMAYPNIKAAILDASFDHLIPLAVDRMPDSLHGLTVRTVKDYLNINIAERLCKYHGPVRFIRRTSDEIVSVIPGDIATNRGNDLALKVLQSRYPDLFNEDTMAVARAWLSATDKEGRRAVWDSLTFERDINARTYVDQYVIEHGIKFPMKLGKDLDTGSKTQILLYLVTKYVIDFSATHCQPLPSRHFKLPWFHEP